MPASKPCNSCKIRFTPPASNPRRLNCFTCRPAFAPPGARPASAEVPANVPTSAAAPYAQPGPVQGELEQVTRKELLAYGRLATISGQICVRLARQMDDSALTGSQVSSLGAQLERSFAKAIAGAKPPPDELDEIAERRRRMLAEQAAAEGAG